MKIDKSAIGIFLIAAQKAFAAFMAQKYKGRNWPRFYHNARIEYFENAAFLLNSECLGRIAAAVEDSKIKVKNEKEYAALHFLFYAFQYFAMAAFNGDFGYKIRGEGGLLTYFERDFCGACFDFIEKQYGAKKARQFVDAAQIYFDVLSFDFALCKEYKASPATKKPEGALAFALLQYKEFQKEWRQFVDVKQPRGVILVGA